MDFSIYYGKISNSGFDENGNYNGGAAGDQTGHEWEIKDFYIRPWNTVLRHPKREVRQMIAELGVEGAKNNNIGYEDGSRTYWPALEKAGYRPSKITSKVEADCSKGVLANVKAVGYLLGIKELQEVNQYGWTGNMTDDLVKHGFKKLTDKKYLESTDYLLPGDILLLAPGHTCTNLGIGKYAYQEVDYLQKGFQGPTVKTLQENLKKSGFYTGSKIDGIFGAKTEESLVKFKKDQKISQQTIYGPVTKEKLEAYIKAKQGAAVITTTAPVETSKPATSRKVTPAQIIERAAAYVGYEEKASNKNLEDFHANKGSNNFQKFQPLAGQGNGDQWCQFYVDGIFVQTAGSMKDAQRLLYMDTSKTKMTGYTPQGKANFVNNKRWYTTPQPGDIIYFYSTDKGRVGHVGIVEKVDTANKKVYTIEGNTRSDSYSENGGMVARHSYSYASIGGTNRVNGFGRPNYDNVVITNAAAPLPNGKTSSTTIPISTPATTTATTTVEKDKNGITINKTGKYNETAQAIGKATVLLNVRRGPSKDYQNLVSYPVITAETKVEICDAIKIANGDIWYFVRLDGLQGKKLGFVNSNFIKVIK